jgi:hypothetical protein
MAAAGGGHLIHARAAILRDHHPSGLHQPRLFQSSEPSSMRSTSNVNGEFTARNEKEPI